MRTTTCLNRNPNRSSACSGMYLYQAHEVGLADCLKWALDNNLLNQSNLEDYQSMELLIRHVRECKSNPVDEDGYEHAASIYYYGPAGYHPAG